MPIRPPSPGALVDNKYRLAERIGGGGMGDVYRAENVNAGRPVAIKFLHPELAQNMEVAQRFFQEAQAVNKIRHPNVVDVIDAGTGEMGPYIVMEYLDGESVGSALTRSGRFDVDAAVGIALPVLEALDAAHRVGIIHRDLKPENVFIAYDAARNQVVVRLLDFGIAKVLDANGPSPRTRTGVVFGTPDYLSPEQATGEGPLDGRSDLFAVGVLVYELVTGLRPFRAPTAVATAFKVVHADAPSIAASGVHVDTRLEAVVHRLLQKEPSRRFAVAGDVIRELEKVSPDPQRRMLALAKLVGVAKRLAMGSSGYDSDRSGGGTKRPDLAAMTTQSAGRGAAPVGVRPTQPSDVGLPSKPVSSGRTAEPPRAPETPRAVRSSIGVSAVGDLPGLPKTLRSPAPLANASESAPRSNRPEVRPFPLRFAGKYQVRGPVLRSVDKVILDLFGTEARAELVAQMPERWAAEFRNDSINALVAYDLEALDAYMELASAVLVRDPGRWREMGRLAVDGELHNVVRTLLRPAVDMSSVIRRGISTWARLFSFGAWRVGVASSGKVTLHIGEFEAVAQPLRLWVVGVIEQTARRAVRAETRVTVTSGEQDFTPEIACEIG
ncbi:Serine/threonine protein kinase PrkC, regulator of stationary phase [Minicystis rosea]|nr:Serine/threonine protein kinase PrkC, regulator of stationary phase [Minicystis rosea]